MHVRTSAAARPATPNPPAKAAATKPITKDFRSLLGEAGHRSGSRGSADRGGVQREKTDRERPNGEGGGSGEGMRAALGQAPEQDRDTLPAAFEMRSVASASCASPGPNTPLGTGPTVLELADSDAGLTRAKLEFAEGFAVQIQIRGGREISIESDDEHLSPLLGRVRQKLRARGYDCPKEDRRPQD